MSEIKITVNGTQHKAEYTYSGLSEKTIQNYNKLVVEAIKKEVKQ